MQRRRRLSGTRQRRRHGVEGTRARSAEPSLVPGLGPPPRPAPPPPASPAARYVPMRLGPGHTHILLSQQEAANIHKAEARGTGRRSKAESSLERTNGRTDSQLRRCGGAQKGGTHIRSRTADTRIPHPARRAPLSFRRGRDAAPCPPRPASAGRRRGGDRYPLRRRAGATRPSLQPPLPCRSAPRSPSFLPRRHRPGPFPRSSARAPREVTAGTDLPDDRTPRHNHFNAAAAVPRAAL